MASHSHTDNRHLRSNITLILKNSTIIPFRHSNSAYVCLYCDRNYLFFKQLKEHAIIDHNDITEKNILARLVTPKDLIKADVSDIKCKLCDENFKNVDKLIEHLINVHKKVYYNIPRLKPSHGILGFDLSSEKFKCHICHTEFRFFKSLSIHMNEHSDHFMCHICGKKFVTDHRLLTHVISHKRSNIICKLCNKIFRTISARSYHIRTVHNTTKFKCPECDEIFIKYQLKLKHLIDIHKIKKPEFRCEVCLKEYANAGSLRAHVRHSHLKTKEYPCEICGKIFAYKYTWKKHLDIHTGTKNFECKYCNKKFGKAYTLKVHLRIHLNDKRFVCELCKAAFIQKCSLKNHIRVHHPDSGIDLSKL